MIGTIRKHKAWVWAIVITATIVSFVIYFNPNAKSGGRGVALNLGSINGRPVSQSDYSAARREADLRYFVSYGEWPDRAGKQNNFDPEQETYQRLFLNQKMEEFHIDVANDAVGLMARDILATLDHGKPMALETFEQQVLHARNLTIEDFERFLKHHLGTMQLIKLVGSGGDLMTPQEARMLYVRENEEISAQAVVFSATNYLAAVPATPETIAQFYTNQLAYYRLPERVQVSYVEFSLSNYLDEASQEMAKLTNLDHDIDMEILQSGTNYFGGTHNAAEAKLKMREVTQRNIAGTAAVKAAKEFATELFDADHNPENLTKLAQKKNFAVRVTEPFDRDVGPKEFSIPVNFARVAFSLTPDEPFGGPVPSETAAYVMALNKQLPSEIPSLESIHARVVADYMRVASTQLARQATLNFFTAVTNAVAGGKSFSIACLDQHVQPSPLPLFSLSTRELPDADKFVNLTVLKQAAFGVLPGSANIAATDDGGLVVFVNSRLPVDAARMNADLPRFIAAVRQSRQQQAFNVWFNREASRALGEIPALQKKSAK